MRSTYSPQEFGELIGRANKTLQKWEREGKLKARRSPITNRRYYTRDRYLQYTDIVAMNGEAMSPGQELVPGCGNLGIEEQQSGVYRIGGFKGAKWYNKQLDKIRSKRAKCKKKSLPSTSTRAAKQFVFRMHFVSFQEGFECLSRVDTLSLPC